ncbi:class I adenylate-forming enzyme family protein [Halorussus halobius]|uniref:class I adenylate-forming enzyme family protein n=1 Tax=Halorussus halobius TaxID=1710537 RepID=UPI0010932F71|nr:class I adenylate-forming enzyme family protein [Halorussus halobius]
MTLSLSRRADLWGNRTALVDASADRRVSYADLDAEADAMVRRLATLGVEPGDAVAVLSRNRVETLALLFAVRRLGGAFAPVSHRLTPATVAGPLAAVDPELVVHEAAQRDLVREVADDVSVSFEELAREDATEYERADPAPADSLLALHGTADADRPAVGEGARSNRPGESLDEDPRTASRVADLPARAVEWNCVTAVAAWGLGRDDCAPALLPFSDADGLLGLALPLLYVGGRVVVLRAFDPESTLAAVAEEDVTALVAGATEYRELVESDGFEATDFGRVAWAATRSALPGDVRAALAREVPVCRTYGRAETGPNNLLVPPGRAEGAHDVTGPAPDRVGRPFPDCEVRLVDPESGDTVAEGGIGELQFRGPVTARGYVPVDGELQATDEFPEWVSTGDLASREDGDYYLLGHANETIGEASQRVHPCEIERALAGREDVSAAGVVPDSAGVLAAFVGEATPGELRSVVADALPEDATVRRVERAASLPRRPTGELDRAALRRQFEGEERFDEG